jgi:hypothetical protein
MAIFTKILCSAAAYSKINFAEKKIFSCLFLLSQLLDLNYSNLWPYSQRSHDLQRYNKKSIYIKEYFLISFSSTPAVKLWIDL